MKYVSLFSGIGGFELGFDLADMECAAQVEINDQARSILDRYWPGVRKFTDVRKFGNEQFARGTIDLVCGGFPCQDVSIAGRRAGLTGERSGLWYEFARVIDELEPRWVVIENVPGLLSSCGCPTCGAVRRILRVHSYLRRKRKIHKFCPVCTAGGRMLESHKGRDFAKIVQWLVQRGYGVSWRVLDAQYFGVAQRRRRVFVVASFGSGRSAQVLFESEGLPGDTPPSRETGKEVAYTLRADPSRSGDKGDRGINTTLVTYAFNQKASGGRSMPIEEDMSPTLETNRQGMAVAMGGKKQQKYVLNLANSGANQNNVKKSDVADTVDTWGTQAAARLPLVLSSAQANAELLEDQSPTPTLLHEQPIVAFPEEHPTVIQHAIIGRDKGGPEAKGWRDDGAAWTLDGRGEADAVSLPSGVRRLTPTECERLQGFPDGWTEGQADTVRYRQLGNAIAVVCAAWLGKRIVRADSL